MEPLRFLVDIYTLVVFVSVIGSWVGQGNQVFALADKLTEPALAPLRQLIPPAGGFDLSPMILLIGLQILSQVLS